MYIFIDTSRSQRDVVMADIDDILFVIVTEEDNSLQSAKFSLHCENRKKYLVGWKYSKEEVDFVIFSKRKCHYILKRQRREHRLNHLCDNLLLWQGRWVSHWFRWFFIESIQDQHSWLELSRETLRSLVRIHDISLIKSFIETYDELEIIIVIDCMYGWLAGMLLQQGEVVWLLVLAYLLVQ